MSIFYENFSKLCELKGVSLAEAADACGISRGIIYKWRERNSVPNTATRLAIAGYFNVPVEMLSQWGAFDEGLPEKPADAPLEYVQADVEDNARAARRCQIIDRTAGMTLAQLEQIIGLLDVMFPAEG